MISSRVRDRDLATMLVESSEYKLITPIGDTIMAIKKAKKVAKKAVKKVAKKAVKKVAKKAVKKVAKKAAKKTAKRK
jgi:hypothetical protein